MTSENKKLRQQLAAVEARAFAFDKMTFELNDKLAAAESRCARLEALYREFRHESYYPRYGNQGELRRNLVAYATETEAAIAAAKEGTNE